jgi:type I restriction-modification system DNA methylase subunit
MLIDNVIEGVSLPPQLFYGTGIPLVVLNKINRIT